MSRSDLTAVESPTEGPSLPVEGREERGPSGSQGANGEEG